MVFCLKTANFSRICQEHEIKFIGALPEQIDSMGDKASAKETMRKAKVPTIPGSVGILKDFQDAKNVANKITYPVMLKATAGGGGKGMRLCWNDEELVMVGLQLEMKQLQHSEMTACTWKNLLKSLDI